MPLTIYFYPHNALLTMNVQFRSGVNGESMQAAIARIGSAIQKSYSDIRQIYLEASSLGTSAVRFPVSAIQ